MSLNLLDFYPPEDRKEVKKFLDMPLPGVERTTFRGYKIIQGFSPETIEYTADHMKYNSGDVIVASYTKTGTQWTMEMIRRMLYQSKEQDEISKQFSFSFRMLEYCAGSKKFELLDKLPIERRLMFTHLPAGLMDVEKIKKANAKIVFTLRNPKDQMVSFLHFFQKIKAINTEPLNSMCNSGWDRFFNEVVAGNFAMNTKPGEWYPEHILSWYKHRDNKNVYFICYEDMVRDTFKEVKALASFLEIPITDEKIKAVIDQCSLNNMKQHSETLENESMKEFLQMNVRKGGVGGWKNYFTVSQSERIDAIMEEKFKDTDIKFTYE